MLYRKLPNVSPNLIGTAYFKGLTCSHFSKKFKELASNNGYNYKNYIFIAYFSSIKTICNF